MEKYHTFSPRFFALLIDGIILFTIYYFYELILIVPEMPVTIMIAGLILSNICYSFYSIYLHTVYGQTLGKMVLKIKVLDISENPIKFRQAFLRELPNIITGIVCLGSDIYQLSNVGVNENFRKNLFNDIVGFILLLWLIAEFIVALSNQKRRSIHDFIAGTVVVRINY